MGQWWSNFKTWWSKEDDTQSIREPDKKKPKSKYIIPAGPCLRIRIIYCRKQEKIQRAMGRLKAGAHFDTVADEFNEAGASKGGDTGYWLVDQLPDGAYKTCAKSLPVSTTDHPVYNDPPILDINGGYIIMMINDKS